MMKMIHGAIYGACVSKILLTQAEGLSH